VIRPVCSIGYYKVDEPSWSKIVSGLTACRRGAESQSGRPVATFIKPALFAKKIHDAFPCQPGTSQGVINFFTENAFTQTSLITRQQNILPLLIFPSIGLIGRAPSLICSSRQTCNTGFLIAPKSSHVRESKHLASSSILASTKIKRTHGSPESPF
jgi:hypothetical protein